MKILWSVVRVLGALVISVVTIVGGLFVYGSLDKKDTFYVKGANFSHFEYRSSQEKKLESVDADREVWDEFSADLHRISKGDGAIMAYRWSSDGDFLTDDDGQFKNLTIWVSEIPREYPTQLDLTNTDRPSPEGEGFGWRLKSPGRSRRQQAIIRSL